VRDALLDFWNTGSGLPVFGSSQRPAEWSNQNVTAGRFEVATLLLSAYSNFIPKISHLMR